MIGQFINMFIISSIMSLIRLSQRQLYRNSLAKNIVVEYNDLNNGKDLTEIIEKAYGPTGIL